MEPLFLNEIGLPNSDEIDELGLALFHDLSTDIRYGARIHNMVLC